MSFTPGDTDTPLAVDVDTFWTVNSGYCDVLTYDVVMDDGLGGYVASSHLSLVGNTLHLDLTTPTSPFVQTHFLRATTASGQPEVQAFTFRICGAESVSTSVTTVEDYF